MSSQTFESIRNRLFENASKDESMSPAMSDTLRRLADNKIQQAMSSVIDYYTVFVTKEVSELDEAYRQVADIHAFSTMKELLDFVCSVREELEQKLSVPTFLDVCTVLVQLPRLANRQFDSLLVRDYKDDLERMKKAESGK